MNVSMTINLGARPFSNEDVIKTRKFAMKRFKQEIENQPRSSFIIRYGTYQKLSDRNQNSLGTAKATYALTGRELFIKGIANLKGNEELELAVITEPYILKNILTNHPYVVKLYEVLRDRHDNFVLESEYHGHGSCHDLMVSDPDRFNSKRIGHFVSCVSSALAYCHSNHIAHCDIKPHNVLVTRSGDFCLTDFAASRFLEHGVAPHTFNVNPMGHAPPEILLQLSWSFSVDMWSLGCSALALYCMHTKQNVPLLWGAGQETTTYMHLIHISSMFGEIPEDMLQAAHINQNDPLRRFLKDACGITDMCGMKKTDPGLYHLLMRMMNMHPQNRITAPTASVMIFADTEKCIL